MTGGRHRLRDLATGTGWAGLTALLGIVLMSVARWPESTWTARAALAGLCVLALAQPAAALLVTFALVGFGIILSHMVGVPTLRVTEVFIAASLAGCCLRAIPRASSFRRALANTVSTPVVLFALVTVASTIVWLRVQQVDTGSAAAFLDSLLRFATHDYFVEPRDFWLVVTTAAILEGLALYVVVAALCKLDETFFVRSLRMLAIGGAALGVMSLVRLAEILLRNPNVIQELRATPNGLRISPQIPDYIAAGSYFALCWMIGLGLAVVASRRRRIGWLLAGTPLLAALYLTGSRSVLVAAAAGLVVLAGTILRQAAGSTRRVLLIALLAVVLMVVWYPWLTGRDVAGSMARQSLWVRAELLRTGVRVMATSPVFGVGLDRFYLEAGRLASPELNALFPARKNPHNDFLRMGAELGLVGLALFLWILFGAGRQIWRVLRRTRDPRLAGLAGGLVAFFITSLISNPLMVREVSYTFWIALGLAVGQSSRLEATGDAAGDAHPDAARRRSRWATAAALLFAALTIFSIPFRAHQLAAGALTRFSAGLFDWGTEDDGTRARWTGPHVTLYVEGRARLLEIPVRGATLPTGTLQQVEIRVNDRLANRITVGTDWQLMRVVLPSQHSAEPRRVDLLVSPTWVPAEVLPANDDRRVLGVKIGDIKVIVPAEAR